MTPRILLTLLLLSTPLFAQDASDVWELTDVLAVDRVAQRGRAAVHRDLVEAQIVAGTWRAPQAGDALGPRTWTALKANPKGWFKDRKLAPGYACATLSLDAPQVMILEASGHSMVYVNGEPRVGDPYRTGYVRLPVQLRAGENTFLFSCGRGALRARLVPPVAAVQLNVNDATLPDLVVGEPGSRWAAVVVVNTTHTVQDDLVLVASCLDVAGQVTALPPLQPLSTRKVAFRIDGPTAEPGKLPLALSLARKRDGLYETLDTSAVPVRVREPGQSQKRTFVSDIDGSVQYFAVRPARPLPDAAPPALVLSLHGAGVEARGQADAYSTKSWAHLVAPTNRRPFGFDWEDWGRLDALEVLDLAQKQLRHDPARVHLTGHSMGGHGTWHLGATFPDRFASVAPSAGWASFFSYGGKRRASATPIEALLARSGSASDTVALLKNYAGHGIYVLHGDADDNVPVSEARRMRKLLAEAGIPSLHYEQPGAKHWWDGHDEPGSSCVDWPPMFDMFARRTRPPVESVRRFSFSTASPGVSARCHWLTIHGQQRQWETSTVQAECDPQKRRFVLRTTNVSRVAVDLAALAPGQPFSVRVDAHSETLPWPKTGRVWLGREGEGWTVLDGAPAKSLKGPHRYGTFKHAFRNNAVLVYGTRGTPAETAWAYRRARYDAETFWYRGNGSLQVVADTEFDPRGEVDRNVVLYGHAQSNAAWAALLGEGPVQVARGSVRVGQKTLRSDELACLFVRPRPGSDRALVGAVTGTGAIGQRLTDRLAVFVSGAGFPDVLVIGPRMLTRGAEGVELAGFFGDDWSVARRDMAWKKR